MKEKLVFIIDDDKVILNLLEYIFKSKDGYEVRTFSSGEECLANLHLDPDLIVMDYLFYSDGNQSMTGMESLKEIRKQGNIVPVIILSGHDDQQLKKDFLDNGADDFVLKADYFIDNLVEAVYKIFGC
jgi:Response regulator containing CheY-like receiver, AAA-type ATPase, and DNA-binding domains